MYPDLIPRLILPKPASKVKALEQVCSNRFIKLWKKVRSAFYRAPSINLRRSNALAFAHS